MTRRDARGRIMAGDFRFGLLCDCGNLKGYQARQCWQCYVDSTRDDAYWERRTCPECGGPKCRDPLKARCLRCENERRQGVFMGRARRQASDHPWRSAA